MNTYTRCAVESTIGASTTPFAVELDPIAPLLTTLPLESTEWSRLPFTLLSDPGNKVAKAWGVKGALGLPGRVTFVFDDKGVVKHRFDSMLRFGKHVDEALEIVKRL